VSPRHTTEVMVLLVALAGCGGDVGIGPGAEPPNHSGFYRGVQTNPAATCAPASLPLPAASDSTLYLPPIALDAVTFEGWGRVTHEGSRLTIVFSDSLGRDPAPPIAGVIEPNGSFTQSRAIVLGREGPREGGHQFVVEQRQTGQGKFERVGGETRWSSTGIFTYRFRDGSATGPVFTTCTRPFTWTATRTSS
jgi:hypothetical protein